MRMDEWTVARNDSLTKGSQRALTTSLPTYLTLQLLRFSVVHNHRATRELSRRDELCNTFLDWTG